MGSLHVTVEWNLTSIRDGLTEQLLFSSSNFTSSPGGVVQSNVTYTFLSLGTMFAQCIGTVFAADRPAVMNRTVIAGTFLLVAGTYDNEA